MKKISLFILVVFAVTVLWYFSIQFMAEKYGVPEEVAAIENIISGINVLFLGLAFSSIVFLIYLLAVDSRKNQKTIESALHSNKLHLEIIALSSLIQECDTTLHRYDRWEEAGIMGDYMNAKASVRDKMNAYRDTLEKKYIEIQDVNYLEDKV